MFGVASAILVMLTACQAVPLVADFTFDHPGGITVAVGEQVYENCTHHSRGNDVWAWSSSNPGVATIAGANGTGSCFATITGVSVGSTTVLFEVTGNSHVAHQLAVNVVAGPATVTSITTTPSSPQARVRFAFTFFGSDFDPVASQVLVAGPGCLAAFCVVAETDMTARSTSSISGRFTASVAGNYQFSTRNGAFGTPSNTYQINVVAAPTCLTPNVIADAFDVVSTGGVMHFGYLRANSNTSTNTLTRDHGIDNFSVTICH